jgi:putative FmdB family regulatory protein
VPIYEYRCPNGHTFEVFQRMADPPVDACTVCGAGPVEKLLFPVAVHFKGSGFYSTDYGRSSRKPAKEGDSGGDKAASDTGSTSSSDKGSSDTKKPAADAG